jgi:predicted PurR-regulated permease PerM
VAALGGLLALFSVLLFTFYLVADGPKMRRAICSRLTPARQERVLATWELAGTKTGGYLYSRALLAMLSAVFHWIVFQSVGTAAPVALALWVGIVSQFLPVVGTYLAGVLPVLLTFLDSPLKAVIVLIAIVLYQQIENYLFAPRVTARTMELHPALAFGAALGGAAVLGAIGAVLALPAAAMAQALVSEVGARHDVIKNDLTEVRHHRVWKRAARMRKAKDER